MYFATFDDDGRPTAFYLVGLHKSIPATAVAISGAHYAELCAHPGERRRDAKSGAISACQRPVSALSWDTVRRRREQLFRAVDEARLRHASESALCRAGQLAETTLDDARMLALEQYAQALRDVTRAAEPALVVWPQAPKILRGAHDASH